MRVCDYGCGREGKFQQSSGKWSCEPSWRKCPAMGKKFNRKHNSKRCPECGEMIGCGGYDSHVAACEGVKYCQLCGKKLVGANQTKFCSGSCAGTYNNIRFVKRKKQNLTKDQLIVYRRSADNKVKLVKRLCRNCQRSIENPDKQFCDKHCFTEYYYKQRVTAWLAGELSGRSGDGVCGFVRRWLIENRGGDKCEACGWAEPNPTTGKIVIEVHHINGDWRDNRPENLKLLCPNCHSLTKTYKSLNVGKGRRSRTKESII